MKNLISMFYESIERGCSIIDNVNNEEIQVLAFNANDCTPETFMEVISDDHTDYFLMPFTPGLPLQEKPDKFDKGLFTRCLYYEYEDSLTSAQNAFLLFCIENPETETALAFEDWLSLLHSPIITKAINSGSI